MPRLQHAHIEHDFDKPVGEVFSHLAEHENLGKVFGVRVERVRDGDTERNGVGSVRKLSVGGIAPFEETVTGFERDARIVYTITKGSPMNEHEGVMVFTPTPSGGTHLDYTIKLGSRLPGVAAIVKRALESNIPKGLKQV